MNEVTSTFTDSRVRIYVDGILSLVIWTETLISLRAWADVPSYVISLGFQSREVLVDYPHQRDLWKAILAAIGAALAQVSEPEAGKDAPHGCPADDTTTGRRT